METDHNKPFTILSAEDDEDYFHLLKVLLTRELKVLNLLHVSDGQELTDYMAKCEKGIDGEQWPDLVLLDLNMPKKNGLEALKEIRANGNMPLVAIVMFTISDDKKDIDDCYSFGANAFITKPTDLKTLEATLKGIIEYWKHPKNKA